MTRIDDKIKQVGVFLEELKSIVPPTLEEYKSDLTKKAACERYVEKIVESVVDLAFLLIKSKKFRIPDDDADSFNILLENKLIEIDLASRLKNAKGMRNIISHQYGMIDDEIVFGAVKEELERDVNEFLRQVKGFSMLAENRPGVKGDFNQK